MGEACDHAHFRERSLILCLVRRMSCVFTLSGIACWYWGFAIAVTAYQAYRGYRLQWRLGLDSPRRIAQQAANQPPQPAANQRQVLSTTDRVILLSLADGFTFALCALSGFYALLVSYRAAHLTASDASAPIAHPAVLIFLALYGVLGATGKLPDTLNRLQAPGLGNLQ